MNIFLKMPLNAVIVWLVALAIVLLVAQVAAQAPSAIAVADGTAIVTLHAEGAQIYQCKSDSDGKSPSQKRNRLPPSSLTENRLDATTPGRIGITSMEAA